MEYQKTNKYQTPLNELLVDLPKEVVDNVLTAIDELPYIRRYTAMDRPSATDCKKDSDGRIIVDFSNPHILSNMDFFRGPAIRFKRDGRYTDNIKSTHPKSSWAQFWISEGKKCLTYVVNPDTGEWISGDYYFYLNYSPIMRIIQDDNGEETDRVFDFPDVYDGDYLYYHYIYKARHYRDKFISGMHAAAIKCRGRGYSFKGGSMLAKRFVLGDTIKAQKKIKALALASEKEYLTKDGILNKFVDIITHCADNTGWGKSLIKASWNTMEWKSGYQTSDGFERGRKNEVIGISMKDNSGKGRGKRAQLILYEEFGKFPNLLESYRVNRPSTEAGPKAFGQQILFGTGGETGSNFTGAEELIYHPDGYRILGVPNIYDKNTTGSDQSIFFSPEVLNLEGGYDKDGNSDVTKALVFIMYDRHKTKYNSSDPMAITGHIAEHPISINEAIMRRDGTLFPVMDLKEYLSSILVQGEGFFESHYVGELVNKSGNIEWTPSDETPLRRYGAKGNLIGSVEIFELPKKINNKTIVDRYYAGIDPYDDDSGTSLGSMIMLDALTDRIVARYTARPKFADEFYEICRRLLLFYNAKANYEAHPHSQEFISPDGGVKLWGDVKVGDKLFAPNGNIVSVAAIPIDENMPIYKVSLADGRVVMSSDNHIWSVHKLNDHPHSCREYTTKDMMSVGAKNKHGQNNFFIPNGGEVYYEENDLPIDAYSMGLILAEGCIRGSHCSKNQVQVSSSCDDMAFYKTIVPYQIKKIGTKGFNWNFVINECKDIFDKLGLLGSRSETKFIPDIYLYNSTKNRTELLRGLMDGDGCGHSGGASIYVTSSKLLADNVLSLCRSLGFNCKMSVAKTTHLDSYRILIYTDKILFNLPRKIDSQYKYNPNARGSKANSFINKTAIVGIEFSHNEKGRCVTVDSDDGLYMVGDYVVTHNCNKKGLFSYFNKKNSLFLLSETPQVLRDQDLVKSVGYGNKSLGTNATAGINYWARSLIKDWLLTPAYTQDQNEDGEQVGEKLNLHTIRSTMLIDELIMWNPDGNFDEISALGMAMIKRADISRFHDSLGGASSTGNYSPKADDPYFN